MRQAPLAEGAASAELPPEDSDAWLAEGAKDLDQQLAQRQAELDAAKAKSGGGGGHGGGAAEPGGDFDAHVMAKRMQVGGRTRAGHMLRCPRTKSCRRRGPCT